MPLHTTLLLLFENDIYVSLSIEIVRRKIGLKSVRKREEYDKYDKFIVGHKGK